MRAARNLVRVARATARTLATLLLLALVLPINGLVVLAGALTAGRRGSPPVRADRRTVLLTGGKMTKALQLARAIAADGHRVILCESRKYWLSGHRFSRAIAGFHPLPDPVRDFAGYRRELLALIRRERVDLFLPVASPASALLDSLLKEEIEAGGCEFLHFDAVTTGMLDDKHAFCRRAAALGLSAPRVVRITDHRQLDEFDFDAAGGRWVLKSIRYDSVHRLDLTRYPCEGMRERWAALSISPERPWVLQEFVTGEEYCTHSSVRDGELILHGCSRSSAFQVNYEHVEHPAIEAWVREFVARLGLSGQISFDFIVAGDGRVYPIECNPRTHSAITMFHDHPQLAAAYLGRNAGGPVTPLPGSPPTFWAYHELWRLPRVRSRDEWRRWLARVRRGTDAIYRPDDPLPFLMVHHWQIPLLLLGNLLRGRGWVRIDFNIGKLVEPGGD